MKKKAFSLIELIFTIIILSLVFMILPKIVLTLNKTNSFMVKQEAIYNGFSFLNTITSSFYWDENNTESFDILTTASSNNYFKCDKNNNFLRRGIFLSSSAKRCKEQLSASSIFAEESSQDQYDDLDDFNGTTFNLSRKFKNIYKLSVKVSYINDDLNIFDYSGNSLTINLANSHKSNKTTNIKKIKVIIGYQGKRGKERNITSLYYYSTNIGRFSLNREYW